MPIPSISITPDSQANNEGNSGITEFKYKVSRTDPNGDLTLNWRVVGSGYFGATAADFKDGTLPSGIVNFKDGEAEAEIIVPVAGDLDVENDESFQVLVDLNAVALTGVKASGVILNDDVQGTTPPPPPGQSLVSIVAKDADKAEGNSGQTDFTFTVSRSDGTGAAAVNWQVVGGGYFGASGSDFIGGSLPTGSVNFADGETSKDITVPVSGDLDLELDEVFRVVLNAPSGTSIDPTKGSADGTIRNDDAPGNPLPPPPPPPGQSLVSIVAKDADKAEGNSGQTDFTFTVSRSDGTGAAAVNWQVVGGGYFGASGSDFIGGSLPTGSVNFVDGETSKDITVPVSGDLDLELDEVFRVVLNAPSGTSIDPTKGSADGTIRNDDAPGSPPPPPTAPVQVSISATNSSSQAEGNTGTTDFDFTVSRSGPLTGTTSVDWKVVGSGYFGATADDFFNSTLPTGTVTFLPTENSKTITLKVNGDITLEPNEAFQVLLTNPSGGFLGTSTAFGTIINDD